MSDRPSERRFPSGDIGDSATDVDAEERATDDGMPEHRSGDVADARSAPSEGRPYGPVTHGIQDDDAEYDLGGEG